MLIKKLIVSDRKITDSDSYPNDPKKITSQFHLCRRMTSNQDANTNLLTRPGLGRGHATGHWRLNCTHFA